MKLKSLFTGLFTTNGYTRSQRESLERWAEIEFGKEADYAISYLLKHGTPPQGKSS